MPCTRTPGASFLIALLFFGCSGDFAPPTLLTGYRVLGVETTPPEATPEGVIEVNAHDFYDGTADLVHTWSLCLSSLGAAVEYECADPEYEFPVGDGPQLNLDLGPTGLAMRQRLAALPPIVGQDGKVRTLRDGFDIWLKLESGPDCPSCESITTVKRLRLSDAAPRDSNHNPEIRDFIVVGSSAPGETVTLRVTTDAPEKYSEGHEEREEQYLYTWYTSAGTTEPGRSFDADRESTLKLPPRPAEVLIAIAVRDGRGGLAIARKRLEVR